MFPTRYAVAGIIMVRSILGIQDLQAAAYQEALKPQVITNVQQNVPTERTSRKRKFDDVSRRHEPVKLSRREKIRRVAERKANRSESPLRIVTNVHAEVPVQPAPAVIAETSFPPIIMDSVSKSEIRRVAKRKEQQMREEERQMRDAGGVPRGTRVEESSQGEPESHRKKERRRAIEKVYAQARLMRRTGDTLQKRLAHRNIYQSMRG